VPVQDYDEWVKNLPDGKKVRYSYQLLIAGFTASMEIIEPLYATIYTHTHTDLPAPSDRAQIEAEFADDPNKSGEGVKRSYAPAGRHRSASRAFGSWQAAGPPNLPKRVTVDELLQPWIVMTVKRACES